MDTCLSRWYGKKWEIGVLILNKIKAKLMIWAADCEVKAAFEMQRDEYRSHKDQGEQCLSRRGAEREGQKSERHEATQRTFLSRFTSWNYQEIILKLWSFLKTSWGLDWQLRISLFFFYFKNYIYWPLNLIKLRVLHKCFNWTSTYFHCYAHWGQLAFVSVASVSVFWDAKRTSRARFRRSLSAFVIIMGCRG